MPTATVMAGRMAIARDARQAALLHLVRPHSHEAADQVDRAMEASAAREFTGG